LNETLKDFLEEEFNIFTVYNGDDAVNLAYEKHIDLILLDVKLPGKNGFEVAKEIRNFSKVPIIFITSLDSEKDVEEGFISGGDDYIRKPFSLKELRLRIDAIFKRLYGGEKIDLGHGIEFDAKSMELFKNGEKVHLKTKVAKLLDLFLKNRNKILSKEEILNAIYEYDEVPNENSLRTFIKTLRSVLGKEKIETVKDVGYKFVG
jgi:DNA-binding response OmpR family regulator